MSGRIVVTGASTGIGKATALHLAAAGHRVFAGVRRPGDADALLAAASGPLVPLLLDVTDARQVEDARARVAEEVGDAGLTGLVNNAGIAIGGPIEHLPIDSWRRQFEVNLFGQVAVTRALVPLLRTARGRIVNVTSMGGRVPQPFNAPYTASKFALEAVSDALRTELAPWGIGVVVVEPGAIATDIWGKARDTLALVRDELGDEAAQRYEGGILAIQRFVKQSSSRAIPPDRVARVIDRALHARFVRTRYPVGLDAHVGIALHHWLPDRVWDRIIRWA